jgi:hypothetical protein
MLHSSVTLWFKPKHKVVAQIEKIVRRYCAQAHAKMGNIVAPRDEMVAAGAPIGQVDNDCYSSSPVCTDKNVPPDEWEEPHGNTHNKMAASINRMESENNGVLHAPRGEYWQKKGWHPNIVNFS